MGRNIADRHRHARVSIGERKLLGIGERRADKRNVSSAIERAFTAKDAKGAKADNFLRPTRPLRETYLFSPSRGLRAKWNSENASRPNMTTPKMFANTGWSPMNESLVPQAIEFSGSQP